MRTTWANHSKQWILVSNVSMTYEGFCELNTSDWFPYVWALPQTRWRLRRILFLKYATQLSCTFQHSHCTFVTILFCIHSPTCRTSILEDAIFHRLVCASSFEVILARQSKHSSTGTLASGTSGSRCISLILPRRRARRKILLCHFCTLIDIVKETAIVCFGTLFALFSHLIIDHGVCLIISVSGFKIFNS